MPHHVLAMGTVLAALGAKAAGSAVDPTSLLGTGAAPISKGMGSALLSLKASKLGAVTAAAPASSFIAHAGDAATGAMGVGGAAAAAAPKAAAAASGATGPGKAAASLVTSKAASVTAAGGKAAGGGGAAAAHSSMLKVGQKACFVKKRGVAFGRGKGKGVQAHRSAATGGGGGSSAPKAPHAQEPAHGTAGPSTTAHGHHHPPQSAPGGHTISHTATEASRTAGGRGSGLQGPLLGQGGPSGTNGGAGYAGAPPVGAEGGEEFMPGPLATHSHSKFLQLHKGPAPNSNVAFVGTSSASSTIPTATITTTPAAASTAAASTAAASTAAASTTAASTAAAAAADHAGDLPAAAGPLMRASEFGAPGIGADPEALEGAAAAAASGSSKGSLFRGFMEGALGMDNSGGQGGMLHTLSSGLGNNLFNNWWGDSAAMGGAAAAMGAAAADPSLGSFDPTMGALDPTDMTAMDPTDMGALDPTDMGDVTDMGDAEYVEEQSMAFAALLPTLFGRLTGQVKTAGPPLPGKSRLVRSDSIASTACTSDESASDKLDTEAEVLFPGRRVYRSRMDDRQSNYAEFLC
ncbi:hypothetical protein, conserved [Eimeria maxima]|uniref:Uncharacterized protein n=1 Tax=Eimeria maxima TaxID=5804 RepID=U6MBU0_EIMMA|nr:hypothetical protein, conserved [Eimeria maxima]CDJ59115.1 hypothetical protein, conserved [Eimeria maxima]